MIVPPAPTTGREDDTGLIVEKLAEIVFRNEKVSP
jgi:hypothetical protein